jgi:hypothetical protein
LSGGDGVSVMLCDFCAEVSVLNAVVLVGCVGSRIGGLWLEVTFCLFVGWL